MPYDQKQHEFSDFKGFSVFCCFRFLILGYLADVFCPKMGNGDLFLFSVPKWETKYFVFCTIYIIL